jgi:hypothetical protein
MAAGESHPIVFPVDGPVRYTDDFGAPRVGHPHMGNDLMGTKLEREVAASDGVISWVQDGSSGNGGVMLKLQGDDGWWYYYIHINNDTPGTDDGANPAQWRFAPGIQAGSRVSAGQFIAYMGDSGDAETTAPHLHFEVHRPDGTAIDPYWSLQAARHLTVTGRTVAVNPLGGYYVLTSDGTVHSIGGATNYGYPSFGSGGAGRAMAVMPDGKGYAVVDSLGGMHLYGSAVAALGNIITTPYLGVDIVRAIAITPSGKGYGVLDGFGRTFMAGDAPSGPTARWMGWDIARSLAFTATGKGAYVLDGFGGVHTSGDAFVTPNYSYWLNWDIARTIVAAPTGDGYAVLDGFGGIHIRGTAVNPTVGGSWVGFDRWAGMAYAGNGHYLMVDKLGGSARF